jgi:2-C-methyl-D-erythritol 4-phosphate cytidylyltransferase
VTTPADEVWTIVVAGGSGRRFGAAKQYEPLGSIRVLDHSVGVARQASHGVVLVVPADDVAAEQRDDIVVVAGGATRSESVRAGLAAVPATADIVCVHDACRPLASVATFAVVVAAVNDGADGAVPALAVTDTIKVVDDDGVVLSSPARDRLVAAQTPQAFRASVLRAAHRVGHDATDDAALVERVSTRVVTVPGDVAARKINVVDDLEWVRREFARRTQEGGR